MYTLMHTAGALAPAGIWVMKRFSLKWHPITPKKLSSEARHLYKN